MTAILFSSLMFVMTLISAMTVWGNGASPFKGVGLFMTFLVFAQVFFVGLQVYLEVMF